jgi:hypothetical protein
MADDGSMEAHTRDFTAAKRRIEEHGVNLSNIVYRTFFLISMPTTYQMTATAVESQTGVTLEAAQNRFLEEWRKRKGQPKNGTLMAAMYAGKSQKTRRKPRNSVTNPCRYSRRYGLIRKAMRFQSRGGGTTGGWGL